MSEESLWASGLASRLRLIQADAADEQSPIRQGYIIEEIERALKTVTPSRRKLYLDSLAERFPSWEGVRSAPQSDSKGEAAPLTPEDLVARLAELAPTLSPEAKASFAEQLHKAGLVIKESIGGTMELAPEWQKKFGVPEGKHLQIERAVKLLDVTVEQSRSIEQSVWNVWSKLATGPAIRREKDTEMGRIAGPYLGGDEDISRTQLSKAALQTTRLTAALLNAVAVAGREYAKRHLARFSPENIKELAEVEQKTFERIEVTCWKKFGQLWKEFATESAVEREIQEAIAKAAEKIYFGKAAA